jgi:hypothetical protein
MYSDVDENGRPFHGMFKDTFDRFCLCGSIQRSCNQSGKKVLIAAQATLRALGNTSII